jgi:hypothetical protein
MSLARLILVLCLIALTQAACARRSPRAVRTPSATAAVSGSSAQKSGGDPARQVRDAIRSLKERLKSKPEKAEDPDAAPAAAVVPPGTVPSDPRNVGTSGAWSVETRYPIAQPGGSSGGGGPPERNRLLTRAGRAARDAGGRTWAGAVALCVIAAALVALAIRRSRTTT